VVQQDSYLGPVVIDVASTVLDQSDRNILSNPWVGGVILFSRNFSDQNQLLELTKQIRSINKDLVIAVDHEGGRVQRFKHQFTRLPAMQLIAQLSTNTHFFADEIQAKRESVQLARDIGWLMASELLAFDIDISFAPVLDLDTDFSDIIGDRAFSDNPVIVTDYAQAFIEGMGEAGMASTGKHFPGHGGIKADSHLELPIDRRSLAELEAKDIIPFRNLASILDGIMPAHILFPDVDPAPVGFSKWWLCDYLKQQIGFNGVIFSDDLSMEGAAGVGGYGERALLALEAGCDSVLVCNNRDGANEVITVLERRFDTVPRSNLERMRGTSHFDWISLQQHSRWLETREKISAWLT
jgi:beta-N-acetylhexosaminidase (EC:3.2.1.52)